MTPPYPTPSPQNAEHPDPFLPSNMIFNAQQDEQDTHRLIWHLCHLCNATTSSISVYLSLEALVRDTTATGTLEGTFVAYQPAMRAHALMLLDMSANLQSTLDALLRTKQHLSYLKHQSYRSLIDAATSTATIVNKIPQNLSPFPEPARLDQDCMLDKAIVQQIREGCDDLTELCNGNERKGIVGWKECWKTVNQHPNPQ